MPALERLIDNEYKDVRTRDFLVRAAHGVRMRGLPGDGEADESEEVRKFKFHSSIPAEHSCDLFDGFLIWASHCWSEYLLGLMDSYGPLVYPDLVGFSSLGI